MQRLFDILFSSLALVVLSPILLPIMLMLRFTGEGEIFYLQERIGCLGQSFKLFKFATMLKDSPNLGTGTITVKSDPRILPLGNLLRKTKINELPQLLNILIGDMSVIGPRPLTNQTFSSYSKDTQEIVTQVRPGLSGVGSIIFRNEEDILSSGANSMDYYRNVIAPYKGAVEVWYVRNRSIFIYFVLIFLTVWVVIFSNSKLVWKIFADLPPPPPELKVLLSYSDIK